MSSIDNETNNKIHPLDYTINRFTNVFFPENQEQSKRYVSRYKVRVNLKHFKDSKFLNVIKTMELKKDKHVRIVTEIPWRAAPLIKAMVCSRAAIKKIENAGQFKDYINTYFASLNNNSSPLINTLLTEQECYRYLRINEEVTGPFIEKLALIMSIFLTETSDNRIDFIKKTMYSLDQIAAEHFLSSPNYSVPDSKNTTIPCSIKEMTKNVIDQLAKQDSPDQVPSDAACYPSILSFVQ